MRSPFVPALALAALARPAAGWLITSYFQAIVTKPTYSRASPQTGTVAVTPTGPIASVLESTVARGGIGQTVTEVIVLLPTDAPAAVITEPSSTSTSTAPGGTATSSTWFAPVTVTAPTECPGLRVSAVVYTPISLPDGVTAQVTPTSTSSYLRSTTPAGDPRPTTWLQVDAFIEDGLADVRNPGDYGQYFASCQDPFCSSGSAPSCVGPVTALALRGPSSLGVFGGDGAPTPAPRTGGLFDDIFRTSSSKAGAGQAVAGQGLVLGFLVMLQGVVA